MEYKIVGDVMQALQVELRQGEEIYAEAGTMLYMGPGIELQARMQGGLMKGLMRKFLAGGHRRLRHRIRRRIPQRALRRRRPVLRDAHRSRTRGAADTPLQSPGEPACRRGRNE